MALNEYTEMKTPVLEGSARAYTTDLTLPNGQIVLAAQVSNILAWLVDEDAASKLQKELKVRFCEG